MPTEKEIKKEQAKQFLLYESIWGFFMHEKASGLTVVAVCVNIIARACALSKTPRDNMFKAKTLMQESIDKNFPVNTSPLDKSIGNC